MSTKATTLQSPTQSEAAREPVGDVTASALRMVENAMSVSDPNRRLNASMVDPRLVASALAIGGDID